MAISCSLARAVEEGVKSVSGVEAVFRRAPEFPRPEKELEADERHASKIWQAQTVARVMLPLVSYFPMTLIFYGSDGAEHEPKYVRYFEGSDLIAGDYLFMRKYLPACLDAKTVVTNTTTADDIALLKKRGVKTVITTTPRYDGRSFGTNVMEPH
jgi:hypothetical protein